MKDLILEVEHVTHRFGGVAALDDCSWEVERGSLTALIGPNGAGKSTLIDVVSGSLPLQKGNIRLDGDSIGAMKPHRIAGKGCLRTFQMSRVFDKLTVFENMMVGSRGQRGESLFDAIFRPKLGRVADRALVEQAGALLREFGIYHLRNEWANTLSGGQKRLLELARAMMNDPRLLMLDEPMAGVNPVLIAAIGEHLQRIHEGGVTIVMVEHNLAIVEKICDLVSVMVQGRVLASDSMENLRSHPEVVRAYLGRQAV